MNTYVFVGQLKHMIRHVMTHVLWWFAGPLGGFLKPYFQKIEAFQGTLNECELRKEFFFVSIGILYSIILFPKTKTFSNKTFLKSSGIHKELCSIGIWRSFGERREKCIQWPVWEHGACHGGRSKHFSWGQMFRRDQVALLAPSRHPPSAVESRRLWETHNIRHSRG